MEDDFNDALASTKRYLARFKDDKSVQDQFLKQLETTEKYLAKMEASNDLFKESERGKRTLAQLKQEYKKQVDKYSKDLLFKSHSDTEPLLDQRQKLVQSGGSLDSTTESLLNSRRMLDDIEGQAISTTGLLRGQRDQILDQGTRLEHIDDNTERAGKIIGRMSRRQITTWIALILVILALIVGILLMVGITIFVVVQRNMPRGSA